MKIVYLGRERLMCNFENRYLFLRDTEKEKNDTFVFGFDVSKEDIERILREFEKTGDISEEYYLNTDMEWKPFDDVVEDFDLGFERLASSGEKTFKGKHLGYGEVNGLNFLFIRDMKRGEDDTFVFEFDVSSKDIDRILGEFEETGDISEEYYSNTDMKWENFDEAVKEWNIFHWVS